jgi:hypothetical protein
MKPTKEQLQQWLKQRHESKAPPPSPSQIREQLGWNLLNTKSADCAR